MKQYATHTTYKGFANNEEQINFNLINVLLDCTPLSKSLCEEITSYLPVQNQFTKLNPIKYDEKYSIIQFITLFINNIIHYTISILLLLETLNTMIPFIIFSALETFTILYFYISFYHHIDTNKKGIENKIVQFNNLLYTVIEIVVHVPMVIILVFFNKNFMLQILFLASYCITIFYRYFMYHRQCKFLVSTNNPINPLLYTIHVIFIVLVYLALQNILIGFIAFYAISIILYAVYMTHKKNFCDCGLRFNFVVLIAENICFFIFGFQLLFVHNNVLSIVTIVFASIAILTILLIHSPLFNMKDKMGTKLILFVGMEFCIHIPMTIILLYYMYSNYDTKYVSLFYAMIAFYFFNAICKGCFFGINVMTGYGKTKEVVMGLYAASVILKLIIAMIFGCVFWDDIQSGYNSDFLFPITIVFIVIVSLGFCVPICLMCAYATYCIFCFDLGDMSG